MKRSTMAAVLFLHLSLVAAAGASAADRLAFVTSEIDNNIRIVDLNSEKTVTVLPTGKTPHALAFTRDSKGYVNNRGSKDLTIIDGNTLAVRGTVALPATSFQLALSPDNRTLAVAYKDALKLSLIDTATDAITRTITIGAAPDAAFKDAMMRHPYWSPDNAYVYASDDVHDVLVKIEAATGAIRATIPLPGPNHYVHPSPDGKLLYAVNEAEKGGTSVTLIDTGTDRIVKDVPVPLGDGERGSLHHGEFTRDGRYFFVCNTGGKTVAIMDNARREFVKTLVTGQGPGHAGMTRDGKYFFVIHHKDNIVTVIDIDKQAVVKTIPAGKGGKQAHAGYFTPDGNFYYMIDAEDGTMDKIDVVKEEVVSKIPVGKASMYFGIREGRAFPPTE